VLFGHSQGGAIAIQLGVELKRRGYDIRLCSTFGMPPPGGADFAAKAAELPGLHVANEKDPVAYASPYSLVPGTRTLNRDGEEVPHRGFLSLARPDHGLIAHSVPRYRESIENHLLNHPEATPPATPTAERAPSLPPADPA
jgi:pimeloyl-ACP methyl ester carboxylesterase